MLQRKSSSILSSRTKRPFALSTRFIQYGGCKKARFLAATAARHYPCRRSRRHPMSYEDEPLDHDREIGGQEFAQNGAAEKVKLPAIFLIIVGVLNLLGGGYIVFNGALSLLNPEAVN